MFFYLNRQAIYTLEPFTDVDVWKPFLGSSCMVKFMLLNTFVTTETLQNSVINRHDSLHVYLILVSFSHQNWLSLFRVRAADSRKVWIWIHLLWYRDRRWKAKCLKRLLDIGMSNSMKRWMHKLQGRLCVELSRTKELHL